MLRGAVGNRHSLAELINEIGHLRFGLYRGVMWHGRLGMVVLLRIEGRHACISHTGEAGSIFARWFHRSHIKAGTEDLCIQNSNGVSKPLKANSSTNRCGKIAICQGYIDHT